MGEEQSILSVKDLQITFAGTTPFTAVNNISFEVRKGEVLAVVGESGSGKSLTALALMGLLPKAATVKGDLVLTADGTNISLTNSDLQPIRGRDIGMVFQEPMSSLNPVMKIGKQLTEAILAHQDITKAAGRQLAIDWLGKVQLPEPEKIYDRYPHQLSGGQKQRVMIAMAMCNHPALLIADEPTTALDVTVQQEVIRLMQYLQHEHGSAMIFITHDLSLAATIADHVLVMYRGDALEYGKTEQVLRNPQHPYTRALLACKPSPAHKGYRLPVVADVLETGQATFREESRYPVIAESNSILQVNDLRIWYETHKGFGKSVDYFKAVDGVSFTLNKGEVMGLVGESGSGKSTIGRCIMGLVPAHSGQVLFQDSDLTQLTPREWRPLRSQIQMIFQDPYSSLNPRMTVGDAIAEPLMAHEIVDRAQTRSEVLRLLDLVQLPSTAADRYPHQFSGGQRQRIGIARTLALRPKLVVCDESVSALDVSIQAQILNLLKDLQVEFQLTYLFISHDLSVVHYFSDRVMIMQQGKIVEQGSADQVLKHPVHEYTKRLIAAMPGEVLR
jgi:peptide/nickel transport system ATP-binding protein